MCTIYAFNRDNKKQFVAQILSDWKSNPDGFSCLYRNDEDWSLFKSTSYEQTELFLYLVNADQYFAHLRMGTTRYYGITRCHGLMGGDWVIFHNGVIEHPGDLDSKGIALLFEKFSVDTAIAAVSSERFANVIAVNPDTGEVLVFRSITGTLYTDGNGSYSTKLIPGVITSPVMVGVYNHDIAYSADPDEGYDGQGFLYDQYDFKQWGWKK